MAHFISAPATTITVRGADYSAKWICDEIVEQAGDTPGYASFRAVGLRWDQHDSHLNGAEAGDEVTVSVGGRRIFVGEVARVDPQLGNQYAVRFVALDRRWKMARRCMGDWSMPGWAKRGPWVVFNEGGRGNRNPSYDDTTPEDYASETNVPFVRWGSGTAPATWTVAQAIRYVFQNLVDSSDVDYPSDDPLSGLGLSSVPLGEFDAIGKAVPAVLSALIEQAASGEVVPLWYLDNRHSSPKIRIVDPEKTSIHTFRVSPQTSIADIDVLLAEISHDHSRIVNSVCAFSARQIVETTYSTESEWTGAKLAEDTTWVFGKQRRWKPDPSSYSNLDSGNLLYVASLTTGGALPWEPLSVTRYNGGSSYISASTGGGQEFVPEELVWMNVDSGGWQRVISGVAVYLDPPQVIAGEQVVLQNADGTNGDPVSLWSGASRRTMDVRITAATRTDWELRGQPEADNEDLPWDIMRFARRDDLVHKVRRRAYFPDIDNADKNATEVFGSSSAETYESFGQVNLTGYAEAQQHREARAHKAIQITLRKIERNVEIGDRVRALRGNGRYYRCSHFVIRKRYVLGDNGYVTELTCVPRASKGSREILRMIQPLWARNAMERASLIASGAEAVNRRSSMSLGFGGWRRGMLR